MANQRHALRKRLITQCEYLETVAEAALQNQMSVEELQEKETMRQKLENIMHDVIREYGQTRATIDPAKVKLKCYGSLASGFAVAGSDMDLLVTFPRNGEPIGNIEEDIKRLFEKALLDFGYGARLLTQTRVPIMRVCETPTPDILDGLRRYRAKWEQDEQDTVDVSNGDFGSNRLPIVTREHIDAMSDIFAELGDEPGETPLPPSPGRELPHLEYTKDCGAQCDINFTNYVALHNTSLLRTYCTHDERVRRMGLIVKAWAKARKINTPYHGTLSSYGYILMLLHFLMNVASPPVVPNVQIMAKDRDAWINRTDFETVDGFDVRFIRDPEEIAAAIEGRPRNQETLGALLRGFFWYYSDHQGFHWTNDIVSIRTAGGILTKRSKGWTEAKWTGAKNTIRNRYLLCIEDPFETEHNIARTVCHSGIVAIRDEFRRARKIIERVEKARGVGWQWFEDSKEPGKDFMAVAEDRGDLLRKDQDFSKLKKLRAEAEATEKALKEANALLDIPDKATDGSNKEDGTSSQHDPEYTSGPSLIETEQPSRKLTSVGHQQGDYPPRGGRLRRLRCDSDDEEDQTDAKGGDNAGAINMRMDIPDNKGLSTSVRTNSSASEEPDESEPYCFYGTEFVPRAIDSFGKLLPWDLNTQEGRWLHWRDNKVRDGTFTRILSHGLKTLNEKCPFHPARALPTPRDQGKIALIRPPFPMCKPIQTEAMSAEDLAIIEDTTAVISDSQGEAVGWDLSVSDCRWLNGRDERMRAGTFNLPRTPQLRSLHEAFPFIPKTSKEEQLRRNEILRKRNNQWLRGEISQHVSDNFPAYLQYLKQERLPDLQDEKLRWDTSLSDGRWLSKRDELVRDGRFHRLDYPPHTLQLHDEFFYIANTPRLVQNQRNLKLKLREIERLIAQVPEDVRDEFEQQLLSENKATTHEENREAAQDGMEDVLPPQPSDRGDESVSVMSEEPGQEAEPPAWEVFNRTGKWLNERDEAIRAGTWKPKKLWDWQQNTNKEFPFIAEPTREEQAKRKEALRHWGSNGVSVPASFVTAEGVEKSHKRAREEGPTAKAGQIADAPSGSTKCDAATSRKTKLLPKIEWDESLLLGTWLVWRDKKLRHRSWKDTAGKPFLRWLDDTFPFVARPTPTQQAEAITRLKFVNDQHPRLSQYNGLTGKDRPPVAVMEKILSLTWDDELPRNMISQDGQTDLINLTQAEEKPHNEDTDYAELIRSQRLNYFASQSATTADDRPESQKPENTGGLLSSGGLSQFASSSKDNAATTATPTATFSSVDNNTKTLAMVPQTLHPGSPDTRPRDEDPNIMPIPSTLAFAFDGRQLRDLKIIQQGGNGCARFGGEWDVEVEGEWGGGGWMGECEKGSSSEKKVLSCGTEEMGGKWEGKGDKEGLLGELPGL
jgi:terminal uridylyltransferase